MDNFMKLAQQGYKAYEESQGQHNQTQQHQGQSQGTLPVDHQQATQLASNQSGNSGTNDIFSQAMSFLGGGNHASTPVDEDHVTQSHDKVYEKGEGSNVSANSLGSAAALQVMKKFMSGGGQESSSGGDFQTKMIAMAMSEAATLFDKSGNTGSKQDAVNGAATTMFKLLVQSKLTGGGKDGGEPVAVTGGSNSGGLGSLLSMASKFTK